MANAIRALAMDAVEAANSGHPGMPMGMADVATVLFTRHLKFDAGRPDWPDRDRFVLSAGHGSMLLYALLHLTGYADVTIKALRNFRQLASLAAGHPEYGHAGGIETTTGPLGQGLANAVGMALAERHLAARFGSDIVDHRTYAVVGDGCLMEGISQEAITFAAHLRLSRLTVLFDDNEISIDGPTGLATSEDQIKRFEAAGWHTQAIDGHDAHAIDVAIAAACASDAPSLIACRTQIAFGAPTKAGTSAAHGAPLGADEIAGARKALNWPHAPFEIPEDILGAWREAGKRGATASAAWDTKLSNEPAFLRGAFERAVTGMLPDGWRSVLDELKKAFVKDAPKQASRVSSGAVLDELAREVPELLGGSADLTGSNNTRAKGQKVLSADNYSGTYLHYGIREHAMGAMMNGLALHGGVVPYAGTFLVFADYMRPAIRLAALMGLRVIYVMTHDSIGLGQDGPTHQPVEHLASLRAIPNLDVFRPADAVETAECWALALARGNGPSLLALSRQGLPVLRGTYSTENKCARGAYILAEAKGKRRATLIATGSEVEIALAAREQLHGEGIGTAVVSMPCWELFEIQDHDYQDAVLGPNTVRVAVEAASPFGWARWVTPDGAVVGMMGFGASAPAPALYEHFAITAENAVKAVKVRL
ncbi:MAG: transketolase [Alphaproteobacteria bacterium]|nr:transketolase [Alphaproteobacteria bacterium]